MNNGDAIQLLLKDDETGITSEEEIAMKFVLLQSKKDYVRNEVLGQPTLTDLVNLDDSVRQEWVLPKDAS